MFVFVKLPSELLDRTGAASYNTSIVKIAAVIFDLDGTITQPCLDFDKIRAEIGGINGPILEAMQKMSPEDYDRAEKILHRHEFMAAEHSQLNPGAKELLDQLRLENRRLGLVTRNQADSVARVCRIHDIAFDGVVTRDDGPAKPDPFPVNRACELLEVEPSRSLVVGDYLFDLVSGHRAGAQTVLLSIQESYSDFAREADYIIDELSELPKVIATIENGKQENG